MDPKPMIEEDCKPHCLKEWQAYKVGGRGLRGAGGGPHARRGRMGAGGRRGRAMG